MTVNDHKIELVREEWKDFLTGIDNYIYYRNSATRIHEIIKYGLNVFLQIPNIKSSSIFFLNQETLEFEHKMTLPNEHKEHSNYVFHQLIEKGVLGKTLQNATITTYQPEKSTKFNDYCISIPLIIPTGVLGIVFLVFDYLPSKVSPIFLKLCLLFGNLFASTIDTSLLTKHLKQTKEILEQKVAIRTMHLAQSRRELSAIFDSVHTGIMVIDNKTEDIIKANPVAAGMIGDKEYNIIGMNFRKYLDFDDNNSSKIDKFIQNKRNFETNLRRANGQLLPILRTVSFINIGSSYYRIESFLDISERKKAEIALKQNNEILELKVQERTEDLQLLVHKLKNEIIEKENAQKELIRMLEREKELSDLKTKFVSMVSHEFRTPLTIIRSSAQLVEKFYSTLNDEEKKEYLERIIKTVDFMKDLIENVIFIGKTDINKIQSNPTTVSINEFCKNVINDFQLTLSTKRVLNYKFEGSDKNIAIDSKLLRHIIVNIISNAIKYSADNKSVDIIVSSNQEQLIIKVRDFGIGIAEEEQNKIFDLFYRGKNVGNISGTGLGMSIILRALEILNGKIEVSSKINQGSLFTVTIPINH